MDITISSELEEQALEQAKAEGLTVEAYVEQLIREDKGWKEYAEGPLGAAHPEFDEVRRAVTEGLEEAERGEGKPAAEVFAELRVKHGLSS